MALITMDQISKNKLKNKIYRKEENLDFQLSDVMCAPLISFKLRNYLIRL